jgi:hypothetical protein
MHLVSKYILLYLLFPSSQGDAIPIENAVASPLRLKIKLNFKRKSLSTTVFEPFLALSPESSTYNDKNINLLMLKTKDKNLFTWPI